jgi:hypothetical protein
LLPIPLPVGTNHWLGTGSAGLNLEVTGYDTTKRVLLQLPTLPYVQFFKQQHPDFPYLDPTPDLHMNVSYPETLALQLAHSLHATRGDSADTAQVMTNYHKHASKRADHKQAAKTHGLPKELEIISTVARKVEVEIGGNALISFLDTVDAHYKNSDGVQDQKTLNNGIINDIYQSVKYFLQLSEGQRKRLGINR